jgi:hypothetical protein
MPRQSAHSGLCGGRLAKAKGVRYGPPTDGRGLDRRGTAARVALFGKLVSDPSEPPKVGLDHALLGAGPGAPLPARRHLGQCLRTGARYNDYRNKRSSLAASIDDRMTA